MASAFRFSPSSLILTLALTTGFATVNAAEHQGSTTQTVTSNNEASFTGRVLRNRVRLRTGANVESHVVREVSKGSLLVLDGMEEDFYRVRIPSDVKAYVYRTYVLDGEIEGSHVNVRLEPSVEAPIIAQLNTGDRVNGHICSTHSKWLEIDPPSSSYFYIAKEYIDNIGGPELLAQMQRRRDSAMHDLHQAYGDSKTELNRSFEDINSDRIRIGFEDVIAKYQDFPELTGEAREALTSAHEAYLQKKIGFLESITQSSANSLETHNVELEETIAAFQDRLHELEEQLQLSENFESNHDWNTESESTYAQALNLSQPHRPVAIAITPKMQNWQPKEEKIYQTWATANGDQGMTQFYNEERLGADTLHGVLEVYGRPVHGKPGDYILINPNNRVPIAFLYSTTVNLQDEVGKKIVLQGAKRPNNNFAFPAYHVLSVE